MKHTKGLGSNGVGRKCSLRKIPTRLRGTNFCTSSARFAPSFVKQPNGPKCTQMVRNAPKCQFRVQWGGSGAFVVKTFVATSWHKFCTSSARFAPSFVTQPNGRNAPKLYEMHQNTNLGSNRIYRVRSFQKISMRLRAMNFCTSSARFALSFVSQLNGPKCTQIL